jgi:hypothetical protein
LHAIEIPQQNPASPQNPALKVKPGALKPAKPVLPLTTTGQIREMLCEDHEVMIVTSAGESFRVFPTVSIAGQAVHGNADIVRLCRAHLCSNQTIRVRGDRGNVGGRAVISHASITPVSRCH